MGVLEDIITTTRDISLSSEAINFAHTTFSAHCQSVYTLAKRLEYQVHEIEAKELDFAKREEELEQKKQQLKDRERKCKARESRLESRELEVSARERRITLEELKQVEAVPLVIRLNVGGTRFSILKKRLNYHKNAFLLRVLLEFKRSLNGEVLIARDPVYFVNVLSCMINGTVSPPSNIADCCAVERECEYYKIPLKFPIPPFCPRGLLRGELLRVSSFGDTITNWIPNSRFQLLYKASVDGFGAPDFHQLCDNKGPTLTVIRAEGKYLFGGYTPLSWESNECEKAHPDMFIFTLSNPHNIPPTQYPLRKEDKKGMYIRGHLGPSFGGGCDICIQHNANNSINMVNFPKNYIDITGEGNSTFTGERCFVADEIEVFVVL